MKIDLTGGETEWDLPANVQFQNTIKVTKEYILILAYVPQPVETGTFVERGLAYPAVTATRMY